MSYACLRPAAKHVFPVICQRCFDGLRLDRIHRMSRQQSVAPLILLILLILSKPVKASVTGS